MYLDQGDSLGDESSWLRPDLTEVLDLTLGAGEITTKGGCDVEATDERVDLEAHRTHPNGSGSRSQPPPAISRAQS